MGAPVSYFERAAKLLRKRKGLYLVSRELLEGMAREMFEAARQLRHAERFADPPPLTKARTEDGQEIAAEVITNQPMYVGTADLGPAQEVPDGQSE